MRRRETIVPNGTAPLELLPQMKKLRKKQTEKTIPGYKAAVCKSKKNVYSIVSKKVILIHLFKCLYVSIHSSNYSMPTSRCTDAQWLEGINCQISVKYCMIRNIYKLITKNAAFFHCLPLMVLYKRAEM